jgi:hypothetical protein
MDTILKGTHPGTIPAKFGLIWFSGFREEDLNVILKFLQLFIAALLLIKMISNFSCSYMTIIFTSQGLRSALLIFTS